MSFFKTGPGEYGEGDRFLGVTVPRARGLARTASSLPYPQLASLLRSRIHEERLLALLILVERYRAGDEVERGQAYRFYRSHLNRVNNWDLVDLTAPDIVGAHLYRRSRKPLQVWARARSLWHRRVAMVSTHFFIRQGDLDTTFQLARSLLDDREDLIHKAVGWMLREAGKRDLNALRGFLDRHAPHMPRTALRYAIERLPESTRRDYLRRGKRSSFTPQPRPRQALRRRASRQLPALPVPSSSAR